MGFSYSERSSSLYTQQAAMNYKNVLAQFFGEYSEDTWRPFEAILYAGAIADEGNAFLGMNVGMVAEMRAKEAWEIVQKCMIQGDLRIGIALLHLKAKKALLDAEMNEEVKLQKNSEALLLVERVKREIQNVYGLPQEGYHVAGVKNEQINAHRSKGHQISLPVLEIEIDLQLIGKRTFNAIITHNEALSHFFVFPFPYLKDFIQKCFGSDDIRSLHHSKSKEEYMALFETYTRIALGKYTDHVITSGEYNLLLDEYLIEVQRLSSGFHKLSGQVLPRLLVEKRSETSKMDEARLACSLGVDEMDPEVNEDISHIVPIFHTVDGIGKFICLRFLLACDCAVC